MSREDIVAATMRMAEAINNGSLDDLDTIFDGNVMDHDAAPLPESDMVRYTSFIDGLRRAFPDLTITPVHIDANDDDVTVIYTLKGTHRGKFLGIAPTGIQVDMRGMQVARFKEGKIVERWGSADDLILLRQLCNDAKAR
ncbi:MAG: ester cyclase, partial [Nitrososphaerota archaeon]